MPLVSRKRFRTPAIPTVAVLCGTDARYGTDASDVVDAARQAGVSQIYLAGPERRSQKPIRSPTTT